MQSVAIRITAWLLAEVVLTVLGTDDIADYGEYVFKAKGLLPAQRSTLVEYICVDGICTARHAVLQNLDGESLDKADSCC